MSSSSLWHDIKSNPLALVAAVGLHIVLIVLLSMNLVSSEVHVPDRPQQKTVKAVVVDAAEVEKEITRLRNSENDKQKQLKREQDKIKQQLAAEKKRLAELKKKQAAEQKKRQAEIRKQAELKKKQEAERKQKLAAEKKRKQEEAKKAELARQAELKRKEEERKQKLAAEKKRKQEEEARRKREEEELKRKLAEEERLEREAREAAARERMLNSMRAQYVRMIEQKVERSWLRPAGITTASACEVYVTQSVLGDVLDVKLSSCQNDAAYMRSIERAVRKASPLPPPPDPDVFDREIHFVFRPQA